MIKAWVNAIRAFSFIENFPQISAKVIAFQRNLLWKLPPSRPFFTNRFSAELASKIPAKFLRSRLFFPRICPWKSHEIWLLFRDLPEALILTYVYICIYMHIWCVFVIQDEKVYSENSNYSHQTFATEWN